MKKPTERRTNKLTLGLDLGDKRHTYCVLGGDGEVVKEGSIINTREHLEALLRSYPKATVIMEAGTHSPWVSRFLSNLGAKVIVANPRKTRAIYQNPRKSDQKDALMLARIGRMDPALLCPIEHGSEEAQRDMVQIKLRDSLVRARVALITAVRFTLKSLGHTVSNPSSERFHKQVVHEVPESIRVLIIPNVAAIAQLSLQIKTLDGCITRLAAERYPQTQYLQQIRGVGPITSLYFVLKIEDPNRFAQTRDVGAFLGLCPKRDQSGDTDKQLRISKSGDRYLRRLLVSAAQYILGPFGANSALRDFGLRLAGQPGARAKKRAVVAVARKLSVLLLTLWKKPLPYQPFPVMA